LILLISFMFIEVQTRAWWCASRSGDDGMCMWDMLPTFERKLLCPFAWWRMEAVDFSKMVVTVSETAWCL